VKDFIRESPIAFSQASLRTEARNGWNVVTGYEDEGTGPFLVDLSHLPKWDLQGENLSERRPAGISVPAHSGHCGFEGGLLVNVVKWNWAVIWCFTENPPDFSGERAFTDVTEACALLALMGPEAFSIMEKVTALDLTSPSVKRPFMTLGPVLHVRTQVVVIGHDDPAILVACPRGYGQSMAHGLLEAGEEFNLRPAGEDRFSKWLGKEEHLLE
jgi:hypothetical protein